MAMLPCLLGYNHIAERLSKLQDPNAPKEINRYRQWIDNYVAEDYSEAVRKGCGIVLLPLWFEELRLTKNRAGREACSTAISGKDRAACQNLHPCHQGTSFALCLC